MPSFSIQNNKITSPNIEYNLVDHCNFNCKECSHLSPYQIRGSVPLDQFVRDLERLASVYHANNFCFVGGEPLLKREIFDFVSAVRTSGITDIIRIGTNGVLFNRMSDELLASVDQIAVTWYPDDRMLPADIEAATARCRELGTSVRIKHVDRFRKMEPPKRIEDAETISKIYRSCLIAHTWNCQTFYDGRFYICTRPVFTGRYLELLGQKAPNFRVEDGIPLHEPNLGERLVAALQSDKPLAACAHCLGTVGRYEKWRQLKPEEVRRPTPQATSEREMIDFGRLHYLLVWRKIEKILLRLLPNIRFARRLRRKLSHIIVPYYSK